MKKAFLFGSLPVLAGVALIAYLVIANKEASRSDHWTQVAAVIEGAVIKPPVIELAYRYEIEGRVYRNPRGTLGIRGGASSSWLTGYYTVGRTIVTYVNPQNAAESLLEQPPRPDPWPLIPGAVLIILGIALGIFFSRSWGGGGGRGGRKKVRPPIRKAVRPMSRLKPPPPIKRKDE